LHSSQSLEVVAIVFKRAILNNKLDATTNFSNISIYLFLLRLKMIALS